MNASLVVKAVRAVDAGQTWDAVRVPCDLARHVCRVFAAGGLSTGPVLLDEPGDCVYFFTRARALAQGDVPGAVVLGAESSVVLPPHDQDVRGTPFGLRWLCPPDEHKSGGLTPLADAGQLRAVLTSIVTGDPLALPRCPGSAAARSSRLSGLLTARPSEPATVVRGLRVDRDGEDAAIAIDWAAPIALPADLARVVWVCERFERGPKTGEALALREGHSPARAEGAVCWLRSGLRMFSPFLPPQTAALLFDWIGDAATRAAHTRACEDGRRLRVEITVSGVTSLWSISHAIKGAVATGIASRRSGRV